MATFSFEDAQDTGSFSFEDAQIPETFSFEDGLDGTARTIGGAIKDAALGNPLVRGFERLGYQIDTASGLIRGDEDAITQGILKSLQLSQKYPGSQARQELGKAWERGEGAIGGIKESLGEVGKDWNEAKGILGKVRALGENAIAMGSGVLEQTPNMIAPMTFGALGGAAGSAVGPAGTVGGAFGGFTVGNATVEAMGIAQEMLQDAGINMDDEEAVSSFVRENRGEILKRAGIKGAIIGGVDTLTAGAGHLLLTAPGKAAANRALKSMGTDLADKAAVKAAMESAEFAERIASDAVYQASKKGLGNIARNTTVAAMDPAGEFTGEYVGSGLATGKWDTKDATLEALSSIGQSGGMFALQKGAERITSPESTSHLPSEKILAAESVDQLIAEFEAESIGAEPEVTAQTTGALARAPEIYRAIYQEAGLRHGVDPNLLAAQGWAESGFNPNAVSPVGAQGIAQFMPGTAAEYGIDPMDPVQAIDGQARYMANMLERYDGDVARALAAYNAGPGRVDDGSWQNINETQNYVGRILGELGQEAGPMSAEWAAQTEAAQAYNQARNTAQLDESIQFGDQQEAMVAELEEVPAQAPAQQVDAPAAQPQEAPTEPAQQVDAPASQTQEVAPQQDTTEPTTAERSFVPDVPLVEPIATQIEEDVQSGQGSGSQIAKNESQPDLRSIDNPQPRFVPDVPLEQVKTVDNGDGSFSLVHKETGESILDGQTYGSKKEARAAFVQERNAARELKPSIAPDRSAAQSRSASPGGQPASAREPVVESGQTTPNALPTSNANTLPIRNSGVNADIETELSDQLGSGRVGRLVSKGKVEILETQQDAEAIIGDLDTTPKRSKDGKIQGFTTPDGKAYLVRDGIAKGKAMGVLAHEMGVHAKRLGFKKDAEWQGVVDSIERRKNSKGRSGQAIRAAMERIPQDTAPEHMQEELVAYLVENHAGDKIPIVDRIIAHIKKWLYKAGIMHADRLSPKDLAVFARAAIREEAGTFDGSNHDIRFSRSTPPRAIEVDGVERPITNSEGRPTHPTEDGVRNFWRWFGDSKVVDADGKPLVVYHGSPDLRFIQDDGTFKSERERYGFGRDSGAHWFAASQATAKTYADPRRAFDYQNAEEGVVPAYLKIENPLVIEAGGANWRDAQSKGRTGDVIRDAIEGGYDGIIISGVRDNYQTGVISGDRPTDTYVVFRSNQIKSATGNTGAFDGSNQDIRYSKAGPKELEQQEKNYEQDLQSVAEQVPKKFDIHAATPWVKTAEYTLSKIAAGRRALEAVSRRQERKFLLQAEILDGETKGMNAAERQVARDNGFVATFRRLKKDAPQSYAKVQRYLLGIDRTGRGFHLSHESGYVVTTPDGKLVGLAKTREEALTKARDHVRDNGLKGKVLIKDYGTDKGFIWTAHRPNKSKIGTFTNEQEAVAAMIKGEQAELRKRGFTEQEAAAVQSFREMTNRAFDQHAEGAREVLRRCEEEGIDPPMVESIDETRRYAVRDKNGKNIATFESREKAEDMLRQLYATHPRYRNAQIVRQRDSEIRKRITLHDAIAQMGDLRGTYFPRQREHGGMNLRAINEQTGEKVLLKGDLYLASLDPEEKKGFLAQKSDALRKLFNSGTPLGRQARKLRKQGFVISFERDTTMPEDVFSEKQLATNIAALMDEGMQRVDKSSMTPAEVDAYVSMHRAVTEQLAGIIKQRGFLSSRMKRAENYWEGFETDPLKAGTSYASGLAGGIAKRQLAQDLTMIITGRDISWKQWQEENPEGTWPEYIEFVNDRKIDPVAQKNLYGETMSWATEILRNQETADRIIGTLKGLAVFKYLAFRIPSAAVNLTNMGLGVPATIASHTGLSLTRTTAQINRSLKTLVDYKRGKASELDTQILTEISERGWDNPQFNHDAAAVMRTKFGNAWQGVVDAGMWLFATAEVVNRRATIHAAYKMWQRANPDLTHEELMQKAHHASDRAHGWYGKATEPRWTRGAANPLKMVWTFQKFAQNYMLNIGEMIGKGDYKNAAYMLLAPVVLGGPKATLATPLLIALANGLGIGGEDPEEELYAWARGTFGTDSWMRFGAPGLLGISFQGSLAMGIPVVSDMNLFRKDTAIKTVAEIFGAPGSVVYDTYAAGKHALKGEYLKATEKVLPSGLGSAAKAIRESTEGVTTESYGSVYYGADPLKVSGVESYLRALSFSTADIAGKRQQQWSERKIKDKYAEKRADINREIKRIFLQNGNTLPPEEFAKILPKIDRYNDAVAGLNRPDISSITGKSIRAMLKRSSRPSKLERYRAMEMYEAEWDDE